MVFFEERIGQILKVLDERIISERLEVAGYQILDQPTSLRQPLPPDEGSWIPYDPLRSLWQQDDCYAWFRCVVRLPQAMQDLPVYFSLQTGRQGWDALNPQFTVYVDGHLRQGLDVNHRDVILTDRGQAGQSFQILLSAYSGVGQGDLSLKGELQALDRETQGLYYDLRTPLEVAMLLPCDSDEHILIIKALTEAVNLLDLRQPGSPAFNASVLSSRAWLHENFYNKYCHDKSPRIYCVGHTHIDVAWLWRLKVTEDKALRSFSTVLRYLEEYPDYLFMSSQPQLYKYVMKNAPEVYGRIKEAVRLGRWEPEGGMFLEADCNLSGGEALVRQILVGKRFFRQEFGRDNEIVWLPDVFGYSAALPQIFMQSGIKYFMTTKISWNEMNKLPCDTFQWEGIDGSKVLTHFSPSRDFNAEGKRGGFATSHFTTYNAMLGPNQVMGAWQRYQQKDISSIALMSFGHGDGGGGPTREMLEYHKRLRLGLPGCPQTVMSDTRSFFHELEDQVRGNRSLPTWSGEMYLEYHRGTYTSMARNKRYNRKSEFAWLNLELYSTLADELLDLSYPRQRLNQGWEVILRNQFHDILPGSSIQAVYEDSKEEYEALARQGDEMRGEALRLLTASVSGEPGDLVVYNPGSCTYDAAVSFPLPEGWQGPQVFDGARMLPTQKDADGGALFAQGAIPPKGWKRFSLKQGTGAQRTAEIDGRCFQTAYYVLNFDEDMNITSLFDREAGRQVLKAGALGNQLMSYEDRPHNFDAWDLNNYYTEHSWPINDVSAWSVTENGPLRCVISIRRPYLDSLIQQRIILYAESRRIDFENDWDWKEAHIFVKALFPVDVLAHEATYEIQYGHVKRPTHFNTSWDFARFEVCHHKWLDVAEEGYGVSLLNDCKYGASVHDGVIGLSLLKSATEPNPAADKERHRFTYALLPHRGGWQEAGVLGEAYQLNNPAQACVKDNRGGHLEDSFSFLSTDEPNVVIEAVKRAEDSEATIVRVYEAFGRRTNARLSFSLPITDAVGCSLMEEETYPLTHDEHSIIFQLKPFQIKSFRVSFKAG
ncbi:MAG: alpha-mannosidase [Christensenellales bacterium]